MRFPLFSLILFILFQQTLHGENTPELSGAGSFPGAHAGKYLLRGQVSDREGNPIPHAAVFIREASLGLAVDEQGIFQVMLEEGSYTCEFSSMGFERKTEKVTVGATGSEAVPLRFVMDQKIYQLPDVVVSGNGEDPAYPVMRKAIAMAPFYLHQVKAYQAGAYIKGSIRIENIPKLLRIQMNDKKMTDMIGKLYVIESQSEMAYTAPDKYDQKVIAYKNSIPQDLGITDAADVLTTNIYDPDVMDRISPLSPGAFSYYRFRLEGVMMDGTHIVNKIQVLPRRKNGKLMSGWLYIIEDTWNIQYADLSFTEFGVTIRYKANYNEVKPDAFLPTAYDIDLKVDVMGIKASGKYYASMQYNEVDIAGETPGILRQADNNSNRATTPLESRAKTAKQQKTEQQIGQLIAKESLTTREAYKLSRLMQETVEPESKRMERESLEIKPGENGDVKKTVDSLATKRDSAYWAMIRKAPLSLEELISFRQKDSTQQINDTVRLNTISVGFGTGSESSQSGVVNTILMGNRYSLGKKAWIRFDGLLRAVPEYNFVDGFWIGQRLFAGFELRKHTSVTLSPSVYYTTARKAINWKVDGTMRYAPLLTGELHISGGHTTADFDRDGMLHVINSFASFFFGKNPLKLYEKRFIEAENRIDAANGLRLAAGFRYEERTGQTNHTSFSIWGTPSLNMPMPGHHAAILSLQAEYTPRHRYHLQDGRKIYAGSRYPTFTLRYERGLPVASKPASTFNLLQLSVRQQVTPGRFDKLRYAVNAGKFFGANNLFFPDAKHFDTNELFVTGKPFDTSFNLLDNYAWSSGDLWAQGHLTWESDYMLLKRLPFLQTYLFDEALHLHTLYRRSPGKEFYGEAGYSIGFGTIGRVGVFAGFDEGGYDGVGITLSLPLLNLLEHK